MGYLQWLAFTSSLTLNTVYNAHDEAQLNHTHLEFHAVHRGGHFTDRDSGSR